MARILRESLGADGRSVPTRQVPDVVVRFAARFLGWAPRPARETVLDCARSLIAHGVA